MTPAAFSVHIFAKRSPPRESLWNTRPVYGNVGNAVGSILILNRDEGSTDEAVYEPKVEHLGSVRGCAWFAVALFSRAGAMKGQTCEGLVTIGQWSPGSRN